MASVLSDDDLTDIYEVLSENDRNQYFFWIGGRYSQENGYEWVDKSNWGFTKWKDAINANQKKVGKCTFYQNGNFVETSCTEKLRFICQTHSFRMTGNTSLTLELTKSHLLCAYPLHVWYHYQFTSQQLIDSFEDKRMTGFSLSWSIKNPPIEIEITELGRSIQTLWLNSKSFDGTFFTADRTYKATLVVSEALAEHMGNGSLVIKLDVETREQEGWQEYVEYWPAKKRKNTRYTLDGEKAEVKTWTEAETYCQSDGGNLASVSNAEEFQEIMNHVKGEKYVWLGGEDQEAVQELGKSYWFCAIDNSKVDHQSSFSIFIIDCRF